MEKDCLVDKGCYLTSLIRRKLLCIHPKQLTVHSQFPVILKNYLQEGVSLIPATPPQLTGSRCLNTGRGERGKPASGTPRLSHGPARGTGAAEKGRSR